MGYISKVQIIERANKNRQYYVICPAPLARALELAKSEPIEWVIEDKHTIILKRDSKSKHGNRNSIDGE